MTYALGIDLGTTYTSAAICEPGAQARPVKLGDLSDSVPTVILARPEGHLYGEIAELRGPSDPTRIIRNVKLRLGSDTPIVAGGTEHDPIRLIGEFLTWLIDRSTRLRGAPPERVAITHPAHWGQYLLDRLSRAAAIAGQSDIIFLSEPEAAGISYVASEKIEVDRLVGVYDFGGGTFDAAVMRRTPLGFALQGKPNGVDTIGGNVFDDAIFGYVSQSLTATDSSNQSTGESPAMFAAVQALREQCRVAKRVLSDDTSVDVPVMFPSLSTSIRITRAEFEGLIQRQVGESVGILRAVIASAGIEPSDLDSILMVGGSSRIPLVSQMLSRSVSCPLAFDIEPKMSVALGAAIKGARVLERLPSLSPVGSAREPQGLVCRGEPVELPPEREQILPPIPTVEDWASAAPASPPAPAPVADSPVPPTALVPGPESASETVTPVRRSEATPLSEVASESSHYTPFVPTPVVSHSLAPEPTEELLLSPPDRRWAPIASGMLLVAGVAGFVATRSVLSLVLAALGVVAAGWIWLGPRIAKHDRDVSETQSKENG